MKTETNPKDDQHDDQQSKTTPKSERLTITMKELQQMAKKKEVDPVKAEQAMKDILKDAESWGL